MGIRTILAATDFSPAAERAVERAAALAARHGATLHLLHVAPQGWLPRLRAWASGAAAASAESGIETTLAAEASRIATARAIAVHPAVATGDPRLVIPAQGAALGVELIVVGAHGSHFVRELLLGSTAWAALALAGCPVLAVRLPPVQAYTEALAGTDLSAASAAAIRTAARLVPELHFTVLHAYEDPYGAGLLLADASSDAIERYREAARVEAEQAIDRLLASLGDLGPRCARVVRHGPPVLRLREQLEASGAQLLVLGAREKSGIERLLIGSVAEQMALEAPCDVLLVRSRAEDTAAARASG
jgi:nucleotide-binding universal stress UspA family protein